MEGNYIENLNGEMDREVSSFSDGKDGIAVREPLLRKRTMNTTTSQIAVIGTNICPINESLDYEIVENDQFKQDWRSRKRVQIFQYIVLKWTLALLIGLGTAVVGFFNNHAVENIAGFKLLLTRNLVLEHSCVLMPILLYPVVNFDLHKDITEGLDEGGESPALSISIHSAGDEMA